MEGALTGSSAGTQADNNMSVLCSTHCFSSREHGEWALSHLPLLTYSQAKLFRAGAGAVLQCWDALAPWAALPSACPSRGAFSQLFTQGSFRGCGCPSLQLCSFLSKRLCSIWAQSMRVQNNSISGILTRGSMFWGHSLRAFSSWIQNMDKAKGGKSSL